MLLHIIISTFFFSLLFLNLISNKKSIQFFLLTFYINLNSNVGIEINPMMTIRDMIMYFLYIGTYIKLCILRVYTMPIMQCENKLNYS